MMGRAETQFVGPFNFNVWSLFGPLPFSARVGHTWKTQMHLTFKDKTKHMNIYY